MLTNLMDLLFFLNVFVLINNHIRVSLGLPLMYSINRDIRNNVDTDTENVPNNNKITLDHQTT